MENKEEILKKINSGDPILIAEAVTEIKENGNPSIICSLLDMLDKQKDCHIITQIVNLLSDIKENACREIFIERLQATADGAQKALLLRIMWESALDYSAHLDIFLTILAQDDFTAAFEASTVIENMICNLDSAQRAQLKTTISSEAFAGDKKFLVENIQEELRMTANE